MKDILETLQDLQNTPIPNLLAIAGLVFLFLAFVGRLGAIVDIPPNRQKRAGIMGGFLLLLGVGLTVIPNNSPPSLPVIPTVMLTNTSLPLTDTPIITPSNIPTVQSPATSTSIPITSSAETPINVNDSFENGIDCVNKWNCPKGRWIASSGRANSPQGLSYMTIGVSDWSNYSVDFDFILSTPTTTTEEYFDGAWILFAFTDTVDSPSYVYLNLFPCPSDGIQYEYKHQQQKCFIGDNDFKGGMAILGQVTPDNPHYLKRLGKDVLGVDRVFEPNTVTRVRLEIKSDKITVKIGDKIVFDNEALDIDPKIWHGFNLSGKLGFMADNTGFSIDNLVIKSMGQ